MHNDSVMVTITLLPLYIHVSALCYCHNLIVAIIPVSTSCLLSASHYCHRTCICIVLWPLAHYLHHVIATITLMPSKLYALCYCHHHIIAIIHVSASCYYHCHIITIIFVSASCNCHHIIAIKKIPLCIVLLPPSHYCHHNPMDR